MVSPLYFYYPFLFTNDSFFSPCGLFLETKYKKIPHTYFFSFVPNPPSYSSLPSGHLEEQRALPLVNTQQQKQQQQKKKWEMKGKDY